MHNNSQSGEAQFEGQFRHSLIPQGSFFNLYLLEVAKQRYVLKVFPSHALHLRQKELQLLSVLNHPNVVRPIVFPQSLAAQISAKMNNEFIVFPEAKYGNLLNYVSRSYKGLSEKITAFYLKQLSGALAEVKGKVGVNHPNLVLDNVLMEESRNLLLCGWANGLGVKREEVSFELAKLGIQLLVGRDPFKGNFTNFLKEQHIHKFWQQTERTYRSIDKSFAFSQQFKSIVEPILLKKVTDLSEVQKMLASLSESTLAEVQKELQKREKNIAEVIAKKHQVLKELHKQEKKIAQLVREEKEEICLERQASRSNQVFFDELTNLLQGSSSIPLKQSTDNRPYFQLFDNDEKVVVAHLKTHLNSVFQREKTEEREVLVDPLLLLQKDFFVGVEKGELEVHCSFSWNYKEMDKDTEAQSGVVLTAKVALVREGDQLWGSLKAAQGPEAEEICGRRMSLWLRETLQLYS